MKKAFGEKLESESLKVAKEIMKNGVELVKKLISEMKK